MPAIPVGVVIYIIGPGETSYDDIVTDIGDPSWFEDKGGGVYEIKANHSLDLREDGILVTGDENDFSKFERLDFAGTSNNSVRFNIRAGGHLKIFGNAHMDFAAKAPNYYFTDFVSSSGTMTARGNITYRPSWIGLRSPSFDSNTDSFSIVDVQDMDFAVRTPSKGFGSTTKKFGIDANCNMHFLRCKLDGNSEYVNPGDGVGGLPYIYRQSTAQIGGGVLFEDCIFEHFHFLITDVGTQPRWLNCEFKNNNARGSLKRMPLTLLANWHEHDNKQLFTSWGQDFALIDGCIYKDTNDNFFDLIISHGAIPCFKNCDFQDTGKINLFIRINGTALIWTNNIFAGNWSVEFASPDNFIAIVFALKITITDTNDNPIEGAIVTITQKDDKERWNFIADVDGKINSHPLLDSQVLCIHKIWVSGDPVSGVFEYWSDDSNSTFHIVEASAFGYVTKQQPITMDEDKTLIMKLAIGATPPPVLAKVLELDSRYL